jgi:DNA-binding NtrC family response regulator
MMRPVLLVVDDEPFVLSVVCSILSHAGFAVLSARSAAEALEVGRAHPGPIRLLLADVIMPGLSGPSLADAFTELHPETELMFMAGLPNTPEICERVIARGLAFLPKPFAPKVLLSKIDEVLAGSSISLPS